MTEKLGRVAPASIGMVLLGAFLVLMAGVANAQAAATVLSGNTSALGAVLTGPDGKTVYLFANDADGVSNCSGNCLNNWPALTVPTGTTPTAASGLTLNLGTIVRTDNGATQVTLNGRPLYYWAADTAAGDTKGHGVNNVWFAVGTTGDRLALPQPSPAAPAAGMGTIDQAETPAATMFLVFGGALAALGALTLALGRRRKVQDSGCDSSLGRGRHSQ